MSNYAVKGRCQGKLSKNAVEERGQRTLPKKAAKERCQGTLSKNDVEEGCPRTRPKNAFQERCPRTISKNAVRFDADSLVGIHPKIVKTDTMALAR
ncbi:hypothetical protein BaRGS_00007437 [Batillaria attramentaria]|uniref:Uncharacterized protein n=1 Tax=Batillaria attramentaria TaxID=370345 RepID=A0ABD0LQF8_9CAEN